MKCLGVLDSIGMQRFRVYGCSKVQLPCHSHGEMVPLPCVNYLEKRSLRNKPYTHSEWIPETVEWRAMACYFLGYSCLQAEAKCTALHSFGSHQQGLEGNPATWAAHDLHILYLVLRTEEGIWVKRRSGKTNAGGSSLIRVISLVDCCKVHQMPPTVGEVFIPH